MNKNLEYWSNPNGNNKEELYFEDVNKKTDFLIGIIKKYYTKGDSVLEIGSNVGRNLSGLYNAGFKDVTGIEINQRAIQLGEERYPQIKGKTIHSSIEDGIDKLGTFDIIYTMAVLEHITHESDWIFPEIEKRVGKYLITIEDEKNGTWKHFPRNYQKIFTGLTEVEHVHLADMFNAEFDGFVLRVFKHD